MSVGRVARIATAVGAAAAIAATAGCNADAGRTASLPGLTPPPASSSAPLLVLPTPAPRTDDPSGVHTVAAPGPRAGALVPADVLVVAPDKLSADVIKRIKAVPGVTALTVVSMASISVEDRLLKVMAVDPSTYRNFTPVQTADNLDLWTRVAGGEAAVEPGLQTAVGVDGDGYVQLGAASDAPRIHVGAWAPQVSGVDAVVNNSWSKALGMVSANALLITTTTTAPDRVVKPIEQIVGAETSVQRLDVVARDGLDIDAVQTAVVVGSVAAAVGRYNYRVAGGGMITPDPAWVKAHISMQVVPILGSVTCNNALFPQLKAALSDIVKQGLADKIHPGEYAGCYYPRFIAGTHSISNHAFGLALDLNVPGNGRGTAGQMDRSVVAVFEHWGFTWGGRWHYTDPMHFEMNRMVRPG